MLGVDLPVLRAGLVESRDRTAAGRRDRLVVDATGSVTRAGRRHTAMST
jgi:hypothetical protein